MYTKGAIKNIIDLLHNCTDEQLKMIFAQFKERVEAPEVVVDVEKAEAKALKKNSEPYQFHIPSDCR